MQKNSTINVSPSTRYRINSLCLKHNLTQEQVLRFMLAHTPFATISPLENSKKAINRKSVSGHGASAPKPFLKAKK